MRLPEALAGEHGAVIAAGNAGALFTDAFSASSRF
jgi:hypothetical protein